MARQRMVCLDGDAMEGTRLATIDNIFHLFAFVLFVFIGSQSFRCKGGYSSRHYRQHLSPVRVCSVCFYWQSIF